MRLRGNVFDIPFDKQLQMAKSANTFLRDLNSDKLIISAEAFSFLRTSDEKKVFNAMFEGMNVNPILFLREKQSRIKSWSKQVARLAEDFGVPEARKSSIFNFSSDS
ncbi:hypothetical protein N9865_01865 [Paraglaciecola sp.]|nr:hypothetical protein [Paraglaciecola sp.]